MDWNYIAELGLSTLIFAPGVVLLVGIAGFGLYRAVAKVVELAVPQTARQASGAEELGGAADDAAMPLMMPALCDEQDE